MQNTAGTGQGFGERLRVLREGRGWSQKDLARAADVGQPQISRIEAGEQVARVDTAAKLARALGVSLDVLAGYAVVPVELSRMQELARLVLGVPPHDATAHQVDSNTDYRNLRTATSAA